MKILRRSRRTFFSYRRTVAMGKIMYWFHACWESDKDLRQETSLHTYFTHPMFQCLPWKLPFFYCRWCLGCYRLFLSFFLSLVDGKWQAWGVWGSCTTTCGGGTQRRDRVCYGPFFGGETCQGPKEEYRQCNDRKCPGTYPKLSTISFSLGRTAILGKAVRELNTTGSCDLVVPAHNADTWYIKGWI